MHTSKIIQVLKSLQTDELKEFRDFVYSPFHNTNKTLCRLFDMLKKEYPEFSPKKVEKEKLYSRLFPSKPYNEQVMKNLSSELLRLSMTFLAVNKYLSDNLYDREINILSRLENKRLDPIFSKRLNELENELKESTNMAHPLFYHLHRLETEKTNFYLERDQQQFIANLVLKAGDYLIYYFITELTRIAIDIHSNMHAFNVKHEKNLVNEFIKKFDFEALIKYLDENYYEFSEMLTVYYYRLAATLDSNDEYFYKFRNLLTKNLHLFSNYEKAGLLQSLEFCCIHRGNQGKKDAIKDEFDVIKMQFESGIFRDIHQNISLMSFRNIVHVAVMQKEALWAADFVNNNIDLINPALRENVFNHSNAILSYVDKDYEKALEYLNKVTLENPFYASDVKTHTAIIFYEQGHYDSALSALDSFRHVISNRDDFTPLFKEVNLHFINTFNSLIKIKTKDKPEDALKLKEKLNSYGMVNHKGWLKRKLDEILTTE